MITFRAEAQRDDLSLLLPDAGPEEACDTWHAAGARPGAVPPNEQVTPAAP